MLTKEEKRLISDMTASGSIRIFSRIIDICFTLLLMVPVGIWIFQRDKEIITSIKLLMLGIVILTELIIPIFSKGKTLGKLVMNLRIISTNGYYANIKQLILRSLIYITFITIYFFTNGIIKFTILFILSIIYFLSFASVLLDSYNRAAYDKISNVYVVLDKDYEKMNINQ